MAAMLKRLWFVLTIPWALLVLISCDWDLKDSAVAMTALGPLLIGPVLWRAGKFVKSGH